MTLRTSEALLVMGVMTGTGTRRFERVHHSGRFTLFILGFGISRFERSGSFGPCRPSSTRRHERARENGISRAGGLACRA